MGARDHSASCKAIEYNVTRLHRCTLSLHKDEARDEVTGSGKLERVQFHRIRLIYYDNIRFQNIRH
jgi:hypothetical protein